MEILITISDTIIKGFITTIVVLIFTYYFVVSFRPIFKELIVLSNSYLLVGSLVFLVFIIQENLYNYIGNNEWDEYALTNRLFGPYWFTYWCEVLFKGFIPQILWAKKIRQNIWTSIVLLLFLLVDFCLPLLYLQPNDYLQSSWSIYFDFTGLFFKGVFFGFILTITFILIKKLPK